MMTTSVTTTNPVRSDVQDPAPSLRRQPSRSWAFAGIGSAVAGLATIVLSSSVDVVYREQFAGSTDGIASALVEKAPAMFALHSVTVLGAVLMIVFAAGLHRRLRDAMPDSLVPLVATAGLVGTAVVSILGSALDTEYMVPLLQGGIVDDATAAMYNHWIGTVPWLWTLTGLAGLGLFVASRRGVVTRWLGLVGLILGGLTVILGISPLEYMSGVTGALWLLITGIALTFGDRVHRTSTR